MYEGWPQTIRPSLFTIVDKITSPQLQFFVQFDDILFLLLIQFISTDKDNIFSLVSAMFGDMPYVFWGLLNLFDKFFSFSHVINNLNGFYLERVGCNMRSIIFAILLLEIDAILDFVGE